MKALAELEKVRLLRRLESDGLILTSRYPNGNSYKLKFK